MTTNPRLAGLRLCAASACCAIGLFALAATAAPSKPVYFAAPALVFPTLGTPGGMLGGAAPLTPRFGFPADITSADVDHDGHPDLLVMSDEGILGLYLGRGDGTFAFNLGYTVGGTCAHFATADLNGDGRLDVVSANYGPSTLTRLIGVAGVSGVPVDVGPPPVARLLSATPNPTTAGASIVFELGRPAAALELGLFDIQGRRVRRWEAGALSAGRHALEWDGRTDAGVPAPSGAYFVRLLNSPGGPTLKLLRLR